MDLLDMWDIDEAVFLAHLKKTIRHGNRVTSKKENGDNSILLEQVISDVQNNVSGEMLKG